MTVDAERELRTNDAEEEEEEEEQESAEQSSVEEEEEEIVSLKGLTVCLTGKFTLSRKELVTAIMKQGGKVVNTASTAQVLVASDPNANSIKLVDARKNGTKVVGEDFIRKFIKA